MSTKNTLKLKKALASRGGECLLSSSHPMRLSKGMDGTTQTGTQPFSSPAIGGLSIGGRLFEGYWEKI